MDRFQAPNSNDEQRDCQECGHKHHYLELNEDGLCELCEVAQEREGKE